jgi:hypothetical protein
VSKVYNFDKTYTPGHNSRKAAYATNFSNKNSNRKVMKHNLESAKKQGPTQFQSIITEKA